MIIGAGFASGREVLEYFNFKSNTSFSGILISAFLFMLISYVIMKKANEDGISDFYTYVKSISGRASKVVYGFMLTYMFCGLFIMFAASGELIYDISLFSRLDGILLMAIVCFAVLSFDIKGIVAVNFFLVPFMICGIVYVAVVSSIFSVTDVFALSFELSGSMAVSALCYAAYNTITAGSVLVPLSADANARTIRRAAIAGGFVIGLLIMLVWFAQSINFDIVYSSDLPMLELAAFCSKTCKRIYALVLFSAITTTAISLGFGLISEISTKTGLNKILTSAVLCFLAIPFALYGFSNAVKNIYALFGYIGFAWIIWIMIDRLR